uniref:Uncharacterized protein n=1 Tax=Alexandrium monilatum TaxID=311494 RepID=A0A7S4Q8H5_9DINO
MLSSFFGSEERRLDPADGQIRTYRELQQAAQGKYPEREIRIYWDTECKRVGPEGGEHPMYNVVNDPFMTEVAQRREGEQSQSPFQAGDDFAQSTDVRRDPFLTQQPRQQPASQQGPEQSGRFPSAGQGLGQSDRFPSAGQAQGAHRRREQLYEEVVKARRHWTEVATRLMGPGDLDRKVPVRNILTLAPWLLFMWVLLVWLLLRHFSADTCAVLTALLTIATGTMIALWMMGKRWGPVSLLTLGMLCLLAICSGTIVGGIGWHAYWRQYWWLQTGTRPQRQSAATSAGGMIDAATIGFWNSDTKRTVDGTYVDNLKSAGFKDTHYYCVAPVLSPSTDAGTNARVNFWAVGIDCCQRSGSFFCDDSRRADAGYGIVMIGDGYPCPDCNMEKFRAAIAKAEALHNLVSMPDAVMLRWVGNPRATELGMLWKALLFILLSGILSFLVFGALGWVAWYYGVGTRAFMGSLEEGVRQKLLA